MNACVLFGMMKEEREVPKWERESYIEMARAYLVDSFLAVNRVSQMARDRGR